MQIKADLHVHTNSSSDSLITPKDLVFYAKKRGLNAVAVTDHNQIANALKIAKETDFLIIPGIEISSEKGHVVGLNLQEVIPQGLSVDETVDKIHSAGGVAIACHSYAWFKGSLKNNVTENFDAIEVINARAHPFKQSIKKAEELATKLRLSRVAGTDAHYGPQIGYAYTLINAEHSVEKIAKAIADGHCQPMGQQAPLILDFKRQVELLKRKIS